MFKRVPCVPQQRWLLRTLYQVTTDPGRWAQLNKHWGDGKASEVQKGIENLHPLHRGKYCTQLLSSPPSSGITPALCNALLAASRMPQDAEVVAAVMQQMGSSGGLQGSEAVTTLQHLVRLFGMVPSFQKVDNVVMMLERGGLEPTSDFYNELMHLYATQGRVRKAHELWMMMREEGWETEETIAYVMEAYGRVHQLGAVEQVWTRAREMGWDSTESVRCAVFLAFGFGRQLQWIQNFWKTLNPQAKTLRIRAAAMHAVLWEDNTTIVRQFFEECKAQQPGGPLDPDVYCIVWERYTYFGRSKEEKSLSDEIWKELCEAGLVTHRACTTRIRHVASCSDAAGVAEVRAEMAARGFPEDQEVYAALVQLHGLQHNMTLVDQTVQAMKTAQIVPDDTMYCSLVQAYARGKMFPKINAVLAERSASGMDNTPFSLNVRLVAFRFDEDRFQDILADMEKEGVELDEYNATAMFHSYGFHKNREGIHRLLAHLRTIGTTQSALSYAACMVALSRTGAADDEVLTAIAQLNEVVSRTKVIRTGALQRALIVAYGFAGDMAEVERAWQELDSSALTPELYNAMIVSCWRCQAGKRGQEVFDQMLAAGVVPGEFTTTTVAKLAMEAGDAERATELLTRTRENLDEAHPDTIALMVTVDLARDRPFDAVELLRILRRRGVTNRAAVFRVRQHLVKLIAELDSWRADTEDSGTSWDNPRPRDRASLNPAANRGGGRGGSGRPPW